MGKIAGQAKIFRDWEGLLVSCVKNGDLLPGVELLRADLEVLLASARETKAQQGYLEGHRRAMTQQLKQVILEGDEAARKLRGMVKIRLGSRSELLSVFGIPPIRKRSRKTKPEEVGKAEEMADLEDEAAR